MHMRNTAAAGSCSPSLHDAGGKVLQGSAAPPPPPPPCRRAWARSLAARSSILTWSCCPSRLTPSATEPSWSRGEHCACRPAPPSAAGWARMSMRRALCNHFSCQILLEPPPNPPTGQPPPSTCPAAFDRLSADPSSLPLPACRLGLSCTAHPVTAPPDHLPTPVPPSFVAFRSIPFSLSTALCPARGSPPPSLSWLSFAEPRQPLACLQRWGPGVNALVVVVETRKGWVGTGSSSDVSWGRSYTRCPARRAGSCVHVPSTHARRPHRRLSLRRRAAAAASHGRLHAPVVLAHLGREGRRQGVGDR